MFEAVTREVGLHCGADLARMERLERDGTVTAVAAWGRRGDAHLAVGTRFALEGASIAAQVRERGGPARVDSFVGASGTIAREAQAVGSAPRSAARSWSGPDLGGDRSVHDARRSVSA